MNIGMNMNKYEFNNMQRGLSKLYVCNYGPGGNLVGDSMYKVLIS